MINNNLMITFYFSFGYGHNPGIGYYTSIDAEDWNSARKIMVKYWNDMWSFQYDSEEAIGVKKYNLTHVNIEDSWMYK